MVEIACLYPNALGTDLTGLQRCRDLGYEAVQLDPRAFAEPEALSGDAPLDAVFEAVERAGLRIAAWSGYGPLIGDTEAVEGHIAYLSRLLALAGRAAREAPALAQPIVCTETGKLRVSRPAGAGRGTQPDARGSAGESVPRDPEGPDPKRDGGELWEAQGRQLVGSLRRLAKAAEDSGAKVAIEPTRLDIIRDARTARAVIEEVGSPALGVCYDPANIIRPEERLEETFGPLEAHILISHAKDVRFARDGSVMDYPPAGKGMLDYQEFFALLGRLPTRAAGLGPLGTDSRCSSLSSEHGGSTPREVVPPPHTLAVEYARSAEELERVSGFLRGLRG
jgi:sugar phosphate isomerase/epimerase